MIRWFISKWEVGEKGLKKEKNREVGSPNLGRWGKKFKQFREVGKKTKRNEGVGIC